MDFIKALFGFQVEEPKDHGPRPDPYVEKREKMREELRKMGRYLPEMDKPHWNRRTM